MSDPLDKIILAELRAFRQETRQEFEAMARLLKRQDFKLDALMFSQYGQNDQLRELRSLVEGLYVILQPRLAAIVIQVRGGDSMDFTLNVGETKTVFVQGFDQFNQPFAIDFGSNPPTWAIDQPGIANISQNAGTASDEDVVGVAAGTAQLSVSCAGFSAGSIVTVAAVAPVLSSIQIQLR